MKHGALGSESGSISVSWTLDREFLTVKWVERGGPTVKRPENKGFGSKLLREVSGRQLNANIDFHWKPEGLQVTIELPAELFMRDSSSTKRQTSELEDSGRSSVHPSDQHKILLVEDEELVALELSAELSRLGWAVVGPAGTLAEARALLSKDFDAAVLDVNLRGRLVYPVAEELEKLSVPFVFCTGYEKADPEGRFPGVPVIRKPAQPKAISAALSDLLRVRPRSH